MIEVNDGIRVKDMDLWLDAARKKKLSFISHAHSDHIRNHEEIITSENTARLLLNRGIKGSIIALPFHQPMDVAGGRVTLFPSGHILGSAQIMIETKGGINIVYTGDLKVLKGETAERVEIRQCDILIIESTYGDPFYVFPEREEVISQLISFVQDSIREKCLPVIFAYPLGKAQEVTRILLNHDYTPLVHPYISAISAVYEDLGVDLSGYKTFHAERQCQPGSVLIFPRGARGELDHVEKKKTAMVTGWALDRDARYRFGVDTTIPLSDHADYAELVGYIMVARPQKVYTTHGSPKLASILSSRGIDAKHLEGAFVKGGWEDT